MSDAVQASSMTWPADGLGEWWTAADRFARAREPRAPWRAQATPSHWADSMHGLGWASLCGDVARGGHGQPLGALCQVLEAVSAVSASAAASVYGSAAANLALNLCALPPERSALMRDVSIDWLAWPAFHDLDEQLWPVVDAQGYLRGQVGLLLNGLHAPWAVLPAQWRDQGVGLVLVDLRHPAVIRSEPVQTLGLNHAGINDVEFGGVPCELLASRAADVLTALRPQLAVGVLAMQCGLARASLQDALHHAQTREQGGGTLMGWGEVRRMLSLMNERLQVLQGLLLAGLTALATQRQAGAVPQALGMELHAGDLACAQASDGIQILGGAGYMHTHAQAQRLCDARQVKGLMGGVARRRQRLVPGLG
ncbi:MAG: acyl-CoA dehydrogenase family protein [Aquabacterium sp.]